MNTKKCPKCGKDLPVEAVFCPYCMEKLNIQENTSSKKNIGIKKLLIISVALVIVSAIIVTGIIVAVPALKSENDSGISSVSESVQTQEASSMQDTKNTDTTTAEKKTLGVDNEIGLRNIKVDSSNDMPEEQKIISQYFDNDYIGITQYEFLARYPSIFEGIQVCFTGTVQKIIKSNDTEYEVLLWVGKNEAQFYYRNSNNGMMYDEYKENTKDNLIIIKGEQTNTRLIVGDEIVVYGRYDKIATATIDGTSYTIPTVNSYRTFFNTGISSPDKFDSDFIKKVAKTLFGSDIEVRNAKDGEDYDSSVGMMNCNFEDYPFMICEPENQSNSRFTKYRMYIKQGVIEDAKSKSNVYKTGTSVDDSEIVRQIEFAPDFEHYLIYTFDTSLNSMSVAYYDSDFQKIWQRDFEETINGVYDYTEKNFYIVANNDLYIIDMATGEDVTSPSYVGEKSDIRKVSDGLIMFASSKADSVMKVDLEGNIVWKTNIMNDNYTISVNTVQFVDDKIIIANNYVSFELDANSGELKTTGELIK